MPRMAPVHWRELVRVFERDGFTHTIGNIHASELKKSKKEIREHLCFFRGMSFVAGSIDVGLYEYDIKRKAYIGSRVKKIQL